MPTGGLGPIRQDWEPVVIHKRPQKSSETKDPKAVNEARRQGATIEAVKKHDAGSNKSNTAAGPALYARKLDEETDVQEVPKVSSEVKVAIQKARLAAKLTQEEFAKRINEKQQVVRDYENGKAIPNQQVLAKMERVLGVKLRGKLK